MGLGFREEFIGLGYRTYKVWGLAFSQQADGSVARFTV